MAGKSLGTLTIDLVAKVGGFVSGMDKAERASAKWSKQVQDDVAKSSAALAGIGAAAIAAGLAVGASGFQLLKSTSRQIAETDRWAKSLQLSTRELLAWQFAAEKAGVSGDQMADIFKDIGDKIGDAVLNKSGEAVDALNTLLDYLRKNYQKSVQINNCSLSVNLWRKLVLMPRRPPFLKVWVTTFQNYFLCLITTTKNSNSLLTLLKIMVLLLIHPLLMI